MLSVVAVFDNAVKAFGRPVFVPAVGAAIRSFIDEVNGKDTELSKHPEDFELFQLGSFNEEDGQFIQLAKPLSLMLAKNARRNDV